MDATAISTTEPFARELYALLHALDPARLRPEAVEPLRVRLLALRDRLSQWLDHPGATAIPQAVTEAVLRARDTLNLVPATSLRRPWRAFHKRLQAAYAAWCQALAAWDIHVPSNRPTNYTRNVFHVANALVAAALLGLFTHRDILLWFITPIVVWAWSVEWGRRRSKRLNALIMRVFAPVAHPHEYHRVNSATWYCSALLLLTLADVPQASMAALVVLGFGDPMAAVIGRRFGKHKLVHGRSLEGTLAFTATGVLTSAIALFAAYPTLPPALIVAVACAASVAGALAELLSLRVDDNLSIPLAAAAAAALALHLFG